MSPYVGHKHLSGLTTHSDMLTRSRREPPYVLIWVILDIPRGAFHAGSDGGCLRLYRLGVHRIGGDCRSAGVTPLCNKACATCRAIEDSPRTMAVVVEIKHRLIFA